MLINTKMATETPNNLGAVKKAPNSSYNTDSSGAPHWAETFANAPLQTYGHDLRTDQQRCQSMARWGSWLRRSLTTWAVEKRDSAPGTCGERMVKHHNAMDLSFVKTLHETRESIQQRPLDRSLPMDDVLILFGDFLAERVAYRAKIGNNEPVTITEIKTRKPDTGFLNSSDFDYHLFGPDAMKHIYRYCLSTTPEVFKANDAIPHAALKLIREFTNNWPKKLTHAEWTIPHDICLPSMEQWAWYCNEKDGCSEHELIPPAFGCFKRRRAGPAGMKNLTSMERTGDEGELRGTMTWMTLDSEAEAIRFGELARTAVYLLDGFVYPGDRMVEEYRQGTDGGRFFELDRFYLPLTSQLNPRRDNADVGPWAAPRFKFSHILHHLRCLSGEKACLKETHEFHHLFGFKLNRVSRCFSTKTDEWVGERRISIAVLARFSEEQDPERCNSLLLLSPGSGLVDHVEQCSQSPDHIARTLRLEHVRGRYTPVFSFLVLYASAIDLWSHHWWHFVKSVETLRQDDDIFNHSNLHNISTETTDADLYFDIIRLLRTAIQWVESTGNDFDETRASILHTTDAHVDEHHGTTVRNFERVRKKLDHETKKLTDKLRQMLEDVSYLRSDLRSAASLREISSANRVNEHLMFLAILTTFYLPLNFIAAICGNSISMPIDSQLKMSGLILGALALVALTWYFPSFHKRLLEKRSCKSCPKGSKSHEDSQPTVIDSKLEGTYKSGLRGLQSLVFGARQEKSETRRTESKKGSRCDRGAPETV